MTVSIRSGLTLALCLTALARVALSQTPRRLADVPLPPGARADSTPEAHDELLCWSKDCRTYLVPTAVEEVFRFYEKQLAARPSGKDDAEQARDAALERVPPRGTTPVFYLARTWSQFLESYPPAARRTAEPVMAQVRKRPPYRANEWLSWVKFAWGARGTGEEVTLDVTLDDATTPVASPRTRVKIEFQSSEDVAGDMPSEDAPDEPRDAPAREAARPLAPPSEGELGVPIYPGARFDPGMSGQLTAGGDAKYFVYTTADPPAKALSFYEQRTGKKAIQNEAGSLIAVRGTVPWPDLGITVQLNAGTYPLAVKTIITIRRGSSP